jgi:hypothetical protein
MHRAHINSAPFGMKLAQDSFEVVVYVVYVTIYVYQTEQYKYWYTSFYKIMKRVRVQLN